jgi:hypothetical protein
METSMPILDPKQFRFSVLSALMSDIDDWCGTPPHPPIPHTVLNDLLTCTAISQLASRLSEGKVREQIQLLTVELCRTAGRSLTK